MDLNGKIAIVTGAGQGIGRGIAIQLAGAGASLAVVDLDAARAGTVTKEIEDLGHAAIAIHADVTDFSQVKSMVEQTLEAFNQIDILVNNAGITGRTLPLTQIRRIGLGRGDGCQSESRFSLLQSGNRPHD